MQIKLSLWARTTQSLHSVLNTRMQNDWFIQSLFFINNETMYDTYNVYFKFTGKKIPYGGIILYQ